MKIWSSDPRDIFQKEIAPEKLNLAVFGLGKIGLPLASVMAELGFKVVGVDVNRKVVEKVNQGKSPVIGEKGLDDLVQKVVKQKKMMASTDGITAARQSDIQLIIVPTLVKKNFRPDLSVIKQVAETIGRGMKKGSLVILESTVPPGTTEGLIKNILEKKSGLKAGVDFGLAFCPERTNSGTAIADIKGRINPKVVGAYDRASLKAVKSIYGLINKKGVVPVSNCTLAEMVKVTEMIYRDVKIAYANSLALISNRLGIDASEVIKAANTDAGCQILEPGPGVGGHCIPVYPYFIFDKVKNDTELLKASRLINDRMPQFVVSQVRKGLKDTGRKLSESRILLLGVTYRGNVKETRFSPALEVYRLLKNKAQQIFIHDPFFSSTEIKKMKMNYRKDFQGIDCVILLSLHKEYKKLSLFEISKQMRGRVFIDTSQYFKPERVRKAGLYYRGVGRL